MRNDAAGEKKSIQSLERAFDILELLAVQGAQPLNAIAEGTGLSKSTAYRILSTLCLRGYAEQKQAGGEYRLGLKLAEIASLKLNQLELKTEAQPYLRELSQKLGQAVHLGVLKGMDVVYIDKVEPVNTLRMYSAIGRRVPVQRAAMGKVLLGNLEMSDLLEYAAVLPYTKKCKNTITQPEVLAEQIALAKKQGYAVDDEENEEGIRCVAAPVYDYRGVIMAAVSVSGDRDIIAKERDEEIAALVKKAAAGISARMGYQKRPLQG